MIPLEALASALQAQLGKDRQTLQAKVQLLHITSLRGRRKYREQGMRKSSSLIGLNCGFETINNLLLDTSKEHWVENLNCYIPIGITAFVG